MVLSLIPIGPSRKAEATEPSFAELSVVALTQYRSVRRFPRSSDSTPQAAYPLPLVHLTALTERYWALTHAVEVEGQSLPKGALGDPFTSPCLRASDWVG